MRVVRTLLVLLAASLLGGCAFIQRSSVSSRPNPVEGNGPSSMPSVSQSGRWVVFTSTASNLVAGDVNNQPDVFVHDHVTGVTELVSVGTSGIHGDQASSEGSISDDGRFVAFSSTSGLLADPPSRFVFSRILIRDRQLGTTTVVPIGVPGGPSAPSISGNGRFLAFVGGADFGTLKVGPFVTDLATGVTRQMPDNGGGLDSSAIFDGVRPSLSDDGSRVTYTSVVPPTDPSQPSTADFATVVADTATATVIATVHSGTLNASEAPRVESALSGDGNHVASVVAQGGQGTLFTYDLTNPGPVPIITGIPAPRNPALSDHGTVIGFRRQSEYVVTNAAGSSPRIVSADTFGRPASSLSGADLSGDGRWVAFASDDPALVPDDHNATTDVFLRSTRSFKTLVGKGPCPGPARACHPRH
jgi:Tol biopolymer transport system component